MKHLLPNICEIATLSAKKRIEKLRSEYWIGYTRAQEALSKMEELLNYPKTENSPKHYIKISQLLESAICSSWESSFLFNILETRR